MKPEGGMFGDIQISAKGEVNFMTNEITCTADSGDGALCRYPPPFVNSLKRLCHTPEDLGIKLDANVNGRYNSWLLSGSARINLKCDRRLPLKNQKLMCHNLIIKVWEILHLDASLIVSFSAD